MSRGDLGNRLEPMTLPSLLRKHSMVRSIQNRRLLGHLRQDQQSAPSLGLTGMFLSPSRVLMRLKLEEQTLLPRSHKLQTQFPRLSGRKEGSNNLEQLPRLATM